MHNQQTTTDNQGTGIVIALIKARGTGSTLKGKNMYSVLGKPVLGYSLEILMQLPFLNKVYVWSEDAKIKSLARDYGAVALDRPKSMIHYGAEFHSQLEINFNSINQIKEDLGQPYEYCLNFNCNMLLFRPQSLCTMFDRLVADPAARSIQAIEPVQTGFCLTNDRHGLMPFLNDSMMPEEMNRRLYRRVGVTMNKCGIQHAKNNKVLYHKVAKEEGQDIHDKLDIKLIEFYLTQAQEPAL